MCGSPNPSEREQFFERFVIGTSPRSGLKREYEFARRVQSEISASLGKRRGSTKDDSGQSPIKEPNNKGNYSSKDGSDQSPIKEPNDKGNNSSQEIGQASLIGNASTEHEVEILGASPPQTLRKRITRSISRANAAAFSLPEISSLEMKIEGPEGIQVFKRRRWTREQGNKGFEGKLIDDSMNKLMNSERKESLESESNLLEGCKDKPTQMELIGEPVCCSPVNSSASDMKEVVGTQEPARPITEVGDVDNGEPLVVKSEICEEGVARQNDVGKREPKFLKSEICTDGVPQENDVLKCETPILDSEICEGVSGKNDIEKTQPATLLSECEDGIARRQNDGEKTEPQILNSKICEDVVARPNDVEKSETSISNSEIFEDGVSRENDVVAFETKNCVVQQSEGAMDLDSGIQGEEVENVSRTPANESKSIILLNDSKDEVGTSMDREMSSDAPGSSTKASSSLRSSARKKLELKMSKKIALTKFPSNARELLATGLLEGCTVHYIFRGKGERLRGTIKEGGILCYCSSCNGNKIVNSFQFEIHAGSLHKRCSEFIFLDNGKSFRDVLKEISFSPRDMLEVTIQNAIGSSSSCKEFQVHASGLGLPTTSKKHFPLRKSPRIKPEIQVNLSPSKPIMTSDTPESTSKDIVLQKKCRGRPKLIKRDFGLHLSEGSESTGEDIVWQKQLNGRPKLTKKDFGFHAMSESPESIAKDIVPQKQHNGRPKLAKKSFGLHEMSESPESTAKDVVLQKQHNGRPKLTKKDLGLHKLVFEPNVLPNGAELAYYAQGERLLDGYKTENGIFCLCCRTEVSPSTFEAHAGWASRRKPYLHIYTSDGVSLHSLAVSLSRDRKFSNVDNDDLCTFCWDGGNLLLCDGCPRSFHPDCVGLPCIPRGDWYCAYCEKNSLDCKSIDQTTERCRRVVKTAATEVGGCVLCRAHDFNKTGFGPRTVILCDQCEKEYHVGCLKDHGMSDLKELPKGEWFCSAGCSRIRAALQKLIVHGDESLPTSLTDIIKKKHKEKGPSTEGLGDIRWRLLSGKIASSDSRALLSKAVALFHDCFDPILEITTGRDLIPTMVFGRSMRDQEFSGNYCAVLTVNSSVVSAGILRIFGQEVAELPLVATSLDCQGQGYFQALFSCIERLLGFLNVKYIVLPAADEAESIWTEKFGFTKMSQDQVSRYTKDRQMMVFQGTSMLQKAVPKCRVIRRGPNGS
ncbi:hypothetical protein AMTR_s00140p00029580 [Amborella trichopoda]|uniref:PHD-type domain-containing protein n=2 Tax=Amborella trichopoda TaxID=13333 RepID=W1PA17_AMBTC|nr:hypothetical protein AMTR_s00140p00029580 [Amborella trichopoda]